MYITGIGLGFMRIFSAYIFNNKNTRSYFTVDFIVYLHYKWMFCLVITRFACYIKMIPTTLCYLWKAIVLWWILNIILIKTKKAGSISCHKYTIVVGWKFGWYTMKNNFVYIKKATINHFNQITRSIAKLVRL